MHVGYIDPDGREVSPDGFAMIPAYPPPGKRQIKTCDTKWAGKAVEKVPIFRKFG